MLLALLMVLALTVSAYAQEAPRQITVLFTHDLHSHLLPAMDENGCSYGGYAELKTAIDTEKAAHPDALYVDGGDFSIGSLFQVSFRSSAVELRAMGLLGVDATTFGNHEYDYGPEGLADMLNVAADSGDILPAIVETNFLPPEDAAEVLDAFERCGVAPYKLLERGGVCYAIVSAFGIDAADCSPTAGMVLEDAASAVQSAVDAACKECKASFGQEPVVICLSHSGTKDGDGEDVELAKNVNGIDLIISGHTHTTLAQPIVENGTYIVSSGEYAKNLGEITLNLEADGSVSLANYKLIPINDSIPPDPTLSAQIQKYKAEVERDYLSLFGLKFDQTLVQNPYRFDSVDEVYATQHESTLCNVFSDAYKWAVEKTTGEGVDVALTATGVIRETLPRGGVTVSDVFTAASLGNGASDVPGGALLSVWLTGKDLKNVLEVDASVQPIMAEAQIFCSGVEYSLNQDRMIFNKVDRAMLCRPDGTQEPIADDQLYRVVTGTYVGSMLGSVKEKSFGLLSVTPRDRDGNPIDMTRLTDYIVLNKDGSELKEWYAISDYLQSMGGTMDAKYSAPDGRKQVYASLSPVKMLQNANRFTIIALVVILVIIAVPILIVRGVRRKHRRKAQAASL